MSDASPVRNPWFNGAPFLFLGLVAGGLVPAFANPRMGLSAHLTAVQCALVLLAFVLGAALGLRPARRHAPA